MYNRIKYLIMDYTKVYNSICERGQKRKIEGYTEKHHIIPKCMGGSDKPENITNITAKEHFLCHKLLCEIYPKVNELIWAYWLMAIGASRYKHLKPYKASSREYERLRVKFVKSRKDKPLTKTHKENIGKANSKRVYQFNTQGEFIKEWISCSEAERTIRNKPDEHWKKLPNNIDACCRLKQQSAYGFIWSYSREFVYLGKQKHSYKQWEKLIKK